MSNCQHDLSVLSFPSINRQKWILCFCLLSFFVLPRWLKSRLSIHFRFQLWSLNNWRNLLTWSSLEMEGRLKQSWTLRSLKEGGGHCCYHLQKPSLDTYGVQSCKLCTFAAIDHINNKNRGPPQGYSWCWTLLGGSNLPPADSWSMFPRHLMGLSSAACVYPTLQPGEPICAGIPLTQQTSNESRLSMSESVSEFFDAQEVLLSASSSENEVRGPLGWRWAGEREARPLKPLPRHFNRGCAVMPMVFQQLMSWVWRPEVKQVRRSEMATKE